MPAYNIPGTLYLHYGILVNVYYWNILIKSFNFLPYKSDLVINVCLVSFQCEICKGFRACYHLSMNSHNYHYGMWQNSSTITENPDNTLIEYYSEKQRIIKSAKSVHSRPITWTG